MRRSAGPWIGPPAYGHSGCRLQRRLRGVHALGQHVIVRRDTLVTAGAILAGQDAPRWCSDRFVVGWWWARGDLNSCVSGVVG